MTEQQLRNHLVDTLRGWVGRNENDGSHKLIVDTYNSMRILPRNYAVTYKDAWCAAMTTRKAHETRINSGFQSLTVTCMFLARYKRVECVESDESTFQASLRIPATNSSMLSCV